MNDGCTQTKGTVALTHSDTNIRRIYLEPVSVQNRTCEDDAFVI